MFEEEKEKFYKWAIDKPYIILQLGTDYHLILNYLNDKYKGRDISDKCKTKHGKNIIKRLYKLNYKYDWR